MLDDVLSIFLYCDYYLFRVRVNRMPKSDTIQHNPLTSIVSPRFHFSVNKSSKTKILFGVIYFFQFPSIKSLWEIYK